MTGAANCKHLRNELASNAGQNGGDSVLTGWLQSSFGLQWGTWLTTVAVIIGVTILVFCVVVCCVLPCCKSLAVRAVTSQLPQVSLVVDGNGAAEGLITEYEREVAMEMPQLLEPGSTDGILMEMGEDDETGGEPGPLMDVRDLDDRITETGTFYTTLQSAGCRCRCVGQGSGFIFHLKIRKGFCSHLRGQGRCTSGLTWT